jgi:EmrB/QacA subfamily drug resistance transporter
MVAIRNSSSTRRWLALVGVSLAVLAIGLDATILSVALPTLATALHAGEADLEWFSSGYLLVLAAAVLPAGLIGDRFGRKRTLLISLALFGVASAACAYAPNSGAFLGARLILGLAGAGVIVMALSAVTVLFEVEDRPKAVGVFAASNFIALPLGPILGGWMLTHFYWGTLFMLNVPVVIVGLVIGGLLIPESRSEQRHGLDLVGIAVSAGGLVSLTAGLIQAGQHAWTDALALTLMIVGVLALILFFIWERWLKSRGGDPLIDPAIFESASFSWGAILAALGGLALIGLIFTMPQYFQGVLAVDAQSSGERLLPLIGGLVLGAVPAGRMAARLGDRITLMGGFVLTACGFMLGSLTSVNSNVWFVIVWMAVVGAGAGVVTSTGTSAALSKLHAEDSGIGSAVVQAIQKVGGPLGTTVFGSVLSAVYLAHLTSLGLTSSAQAAAHHSIFTGVALAEHVGSAPLLASVRSAFTAGMDVAFVVCAGIAVAGAILAVVFIPRRAAESVEEVAVVVSR